jgi:N-acetylmuramoyl-L-alanine amidase
MKRKHLFLILILVLLTQLVLAGAVFAQDGPVGEPQVVTPAPGNTTPDEAQPDAIDGSVTVAQVWVTAAKPGANPQATFHPGDAIWYFANISNSTGKDVAIGFDWRIEGPCGTKVIYANTNWQLPARKTTYIVKTRLPQNACTGRYTFKVSTTYRGRTNRRGTPFTVESPGQVRGRVVLDPGHGWRKGGGIDSGATANGMKEKDITLDIAIRAKAILEAQGITVYLTRNGDDWNHGLSYAAQFVNSKNPDISISIHVNAGGGTGTESCYVVRKSTSAKSKNLASLLTDEVSRGLGLRNRGNFPEDDGGRCARGRWSQIYIHDMNPPAALIETAFIDGPQNVDVEKLRRHRQEFARAIANAALRYLDVNPGKGNACPTITAWKGEYWDNQHLSGAPRLCRNDGAIRFDWGGGSPGAHIPADHFSARWTRRLHFDAGRYRFKTLSDDGIRVWVDGHRVIDAWHDQAPTWHQGEINLSNGDHTVKVEYYENGGGATAKLWWERISGGGAPNCPGKYAAEYFNNSSLSGSPTYAVCEGWPINHDWGGGSPGHGIPSDNFSARWTGRAHFDDGNYTFIARADDGIRVWLDNHRIIDAWRDQAPTEYRRTLHVNRGDHTVRIEYYEHGGGAVAQFRWKKSSGGGGGSSGQTYEIIAKHSGKCLDVEGARQDNGANVQQWACGGGPNQRWRLVDAGGGYYKIIAVHSGKCLDVTGASHDNGANIIQWDCHGGDNQLWRLEQHGDAYRLMPKHSGKALDVEGARQDNGANVQQWQFGGGANQLWRLIKK